MSCLELKKPEMIGRDFSRGKLHTIISPEFDILFLV